MLINCRGTLLDLSKPKVMGILNVTPNSFHDGGKFQAVENALTQVEKMLNDGAQFIDVGACSTKPNADFVSESEEIDRLKPVLQAVVKEFPEAILSVDTFRAQVAEMAVGEGVAMVNDVSAGHLDAHMLETVARLQVPYIMMHMRGDAATMQQQTDYEDLLKEMILYFSKVVAKARQLGINDLIIDPGFGFAKTLAQNYELLQKLELLHVLELPILVGLSRKSMIYKALETSPEEALNGTTVLNTLALTKGAHILRVHDVKEAVETIKLVELFKK
uniref:dihydropteroate synthase n=1 Tax=Flavobacterium sp. TaxID=239 RepID=UPI004048F57D